MEKIAEPQGMWSARTALLLLVNILVFEVASVISLRWFLEVSSPKQI